MTTVNVATDFSPYLGGRYREDGDFSGEEFRQDVLEPAARESLTTGTELQINFDGVAGMPPSFVEEAFGGLIRAYPDRAPDLLKVIRITAASPRLFPFVELARSFMEKAAEGAHRR